MNDAEIWNTASRPIFFCAEPYLKRHLKTKKGNETTHFQSITQTTIIIIHNDLACSQLCIYAAMCVWFDLNSQNQEALHGEVPQQSEADLVKSIHRKDLPFWETECETAKKAKLCSMSQDAGFSADTGKSQCFVLRPSSKIKWNWTLVWTEYTPPRDKRDSKFKMCCVILCALVETWVRRQRIWQDYILFKPWHHHTRISQIIHGWSYVEVWINTPLKYSIWCNELPKTESVIPSVSRIHTARRNSAWATNKKTQRRTAKGELEHTWPKYQNQVTKENRSTFRKQRFKRKCSSNQRTISNFRWKKDSGSHCESCWRPDVEPPTKKWYDEGITSKERRKEYRRKTKGAKNICQEQGNGEDHEMHTTQTLIKARRVTIMKLLDTCCTCGLANPRASKEVEEEVGKRHLTTSAFSENWENQWRKNGRNEGSKLFHKACTVQRILVVTLARIPVAASPQISAGKRRDDEDHTRGLIEKSCGQNYIAIESERKNCVCCESERQ